MLGLINVDLNLDKASRWGLYALSIYLPKSPDGPQQRFFRFEDHFVFC